MNRFQPDATVRNTSEVLDDIIIGNSILTRKKKPDYY